MPKKTQRTIRHITTIKEFKALQNGWNSLLNENHIQSAVLTWEWLFSWWKVFGVEKKLWIVTAWDGGVLVGIAPLMLEKRKKNGIHLQILCSLGTPMNDIGGFIIKNQDVKILESLNNYILSEKKEWDILELNELPLTGIEIDFLRKIFSKKDFFSIEEQNEHYYVSANIEWDEYYASLSRKFRENLRRSERNSNALGVLSLQQYTGNTLTWEKIEDIILVNSQANYPRLSTSKKEQEFLKELLAYASTWFILYLLYLDGKPIAYRYGFLYKNRFEDWRTGFDTRINPKISIGKFMALKVIEKSFEDKIEEIDFMRGAHAYKKKWQPEIRHFMQLRFFNRSSLKAIIAYLGLGKLKSLIQFFKKKSLKKDVR